MATYTLALINGHEDGKRFFDTYNIPYWVITKGANAGKLRVKQPRSYDSSKVLDVRRLLTEQGYGILCDHSDVFRDENDRTVITFSPYHDISPDVAEELYLSGYDVEVSDLSIYGYGTKTIVERRQRRYMASQKSDYVTFKLSLWGSYALFFRPELKVERCSYDVITPSAARGVLDDIY